MEKASILTDEARHEITYMTIKELRREGVSMHDIGDYTQKAVLKAQRNSDHGHYSKIIRERVNNIIALIEPVIYSLEDENRSKAMALVILLDAIRLIKHELLWDIGKESKYLED